MMLQIAETLPKEHQGILACCNPIPPLLKQNLNAIHLMVLNARDQPLVKPVVNDDVSGTRPILSTTCLFDFESPLYCPHDLHNNAEGTRDDLPTILSGLSMDDSLNKHTFECSSPKIDLFNTSHKVCEIIFIFSKPTFLLSF